MRIESYPCFDLCNLIQLIDTRCSPLLTPRPKYSNKAQILSTHPSDMRQIYTYICIHDVDRRVRGIMISCFRWFLRSTRECELHKLLTLHSGHCD